MLSGVDVYVYFRPVLQQLRQLDAIEGKVDFNYTSDLARIIAAAVWITANHSSISLMEEGGFHYGARN
jgi:hypothetical protein